MVHLQRHLAARTVGTVLTEHDRGPLDERVGLGEHRGDRRQRHLQRLEHDATSHLPRRERHGDLAGEPRQAEVVLAGVGLGEVVLAREALGVARRPGGAREGQLRAFFRFAFPFLGLRLAGRRRGLVAVRHALDRGLLLFPAGAAAVALQHRRGRGTLLQHVREFVGDQPAAGVRVRRVFAGGERHIRTDGVGARPDRRRRRRRARVHVQPDPAEIVAETPLHVGAQPRRQRAAAGRQCLFDNGRRHRRSRSGRVDTLGLHAPPVVRPASRASAAAGARPPRLRLGGHAHHPFGDAVRLLLVRVPGRADRQFGLHGSHRAGSDGDPAECVPEAGWRHARKRGSIDRRSRGGRRRLARIGFRGESGAGTPAAIAESRSW